jgi:hypothetical protein
MQEVIPREKIKFGFSWVQSLLSPAMVFVTMCEKQTSVSNATPALL